MLNQVANDRIKQVITSAGEEDFPEVSSETVPIETVLLSKFYDCPKQWWIFCCIIQLHMAHISLTIVLTIVCKVPVRKYACTNGELIFFCSLPNQAFTILVSLFQ